MNSKIQRKNLLFLSLASYCHLISSIPITSIQSKHHISLRNKAILDKESHSMPMQLRQRKGLNVRGGTNQNGPVDSDSSPVFNGTNTSPTNDEHTKSDMAPVNKSSKSSSLSKFRNTIFPIYGHEVKKFLLMSSIKFGVIMALTLTRDTKDTLVVTQCGAEAIAFLKVRHICFVLLICIPCVLSFLFTILSF